MYQTPVFGAVVGISIEKLTRKLHATESWWGHSLGYLLNPFTLLPRQTAAEPRVSLIPFYDGIRSGFSLGYRF